MLLPNELIIDDDCPKVQLCSSNGCLIYIQERMRGLEFVFILFMLVVMVLLVGFFTATVLCMLWISIRDLFFWGFLLAVFFSIAALPSYCLVIIAQSFLFEKRISIDMDNGRYEYISGLVRFKFLFDPSKSQIKIFPYPTKGDWGLAVKLYVASIRIGKWKIPFAIVPNHTAASSKWRAVKKAKVIHEWIREKSPIDNVILELKYCQKKKRKTKPPASVYAKK